MKIHQLRNATLIIETGDNFILVDPMLGGKESLPSFSFIKHKSKKNPLVPLPVCAEALLEGVTHCLITHSQTFGIKALQHSDHLDQAGEEFLKKNNIPVASRRQDCEYLQKYGIDIRYSLQYWQKHEFLGGTIIAVPAQHGHGWIHKMMANGAGFFIELPDEPSLYISGDTALTTDVKKALTDLKPDVAVVAAGNASLDIGGPILMPPEEIVEYIKLSPGKVMANHMEALNHCPVSRDDLRDALEQEGLLNKVFIPLDGETIII